MGTFAGTTPGRPTGRMHKARVDCFCFFFAGTSGLAPRGGKGALQQGQGRGSTAGAGAGAGGPKRGGRLPSRSKATHSIIFDILA